MALFVCRTIGFAYGLLYVKDALDNVGYTFLIWCILMLIFM